MAGVDRFSQCQGKQKENSLLYLLLFLVFIISVQGVNQLALFSLQNVFLCAMSQLNFSAASSPIDIRLPFLSFFSFSKSDRLNVQQ